MGKVEDFAEQEEDFQKEENQDKQYESNFTQDKSNNKKRFFKDGKRKIISGVCSGIGHYFNIDPFWIRLLFVISPFMTLGGAFIVYIILAVVLPESADLSETNVKKLYRDGEDSVLGGVASGIGKYFGTDPVWIRVLFVLSFFLFGTGPIIYLIIWIITPEAKTRSEKMEMEGEPITISNIEKNIKENLNLKDKEGNESTLATILLFPFRLLAQILTGLAGLIKPFSIFILAIIRFVGGFGFLSIGLLMMFVFFILLTVGIGLVSGDSFTTNLPINAMSTTIPGYGMIAGFFAGFFPSLLFVLLGLSLFAKRMLIKPLIFGAIFGFWIISLGVLAGTTAFVAKDFQEESKIVKKEILPIDSEEIILELNGNGSDLDNVELVIKTTADSNLKLVQTVESRGANISDAKKNAESIVYNYNIDNNVITFDESITYNDSSKFKFQDITLELYVPHGKKIIINEVLRGFLNTYRTNSYPEISNSYSSTGVDLTERIWVSEKKKIKCLNCEDIIDELEEEEEENDDEFYSNGISNTYELEGFTKLKITDAFEVKIIQGESFKVKAIGDENDLEDVNIELNGEWLVADYGGIDNNKFDFDLSDFKDNSRKIKLIIQAPMIDELDVSGATVAEMKTGDMQSLVIDISGASQFELETGKIDNFNLEISGASQINIDGESEVSTFDVSGASTINALHFDSKIVVAEASGASTAKLKAIEKLQAETSGVSTIKYKGNPELDIDEDDFSNIKKY